MDRFLFCLFRPHESGMLFLWPTTPSAWYSFTIWCLLCLYIFTNTLFLFCLSLRHEVLSSVVQHKACTTSYIILLFSKQLIPVAHCIFRAVRFLNCDQTCDWMVLSHVGSGCHGKIWLITQSLVCCGGIKSVPKRDKILLFDPV